jgi:hypothetical protein
MSETTIFVLAWVVCGLIARRWFFVELRLDKEHAERASETADGVVALILGLGGIGALGAALFLFVVFPAIGRLWKP